MAVVSLKKPPSDLSAVLRQMADDVDAGIVTDMVAVSVHDGNYEFTYAASLINCLVMASMLQANCIDRMRR
jgi:hypothetical protein